MPNDVSYFKLTGDQTEYAFNDRDAETRITQLATEISAEIARAQDAEQANADSVTSEATRAQAAEQANAAAITAEETRATAAEQTNADSIVALKNNLQVGIIRDIQIPANSAVSCSVTYQTPLDVAVPPVVTCRTSSTGIFGVCRVSVLSYSKTGFTIYVYNDDPTQTRAPNVIWITLPATSLQTSSPSTTALETSRSTLPISMGGTGATTAANARENLDVPVNAHVFYAAGDTYSSSGAIPFIGFVTGSTKTITFSVPLPRSFAKFANPTVEITGLTGAIRGISGYVDNTTNETNLLAQGYTVTAAVADEKTIRITMTTSSTFANAVNNTPVVVFASVGLRFS